MSTKTFLSATKFLLQSSSLCGGIYSIGLPYPITKLREISGNQDAKKPQVNNKEHKRYSRIP